ncbi:hypothetical protein ICY_00537, partial [Bacillus cereus BAG2X1-3]
MKGMDNNAPHGFFGGESDSYAEMMLMGGAGQQGYGGIPSWMGGAAGGFPASVAGMQMGMPTVTGGFPTSVAGMQTGMPTVTGG